MSEKKPAGDGHKGIRRYFGPDGKAGGFPPVVRALMDGDDAGPVGDEREGCVLLVEDDDQVREMLAMALTHGGFDVFESGDGAEALGLLETLQPDLLLTDVRMPGMDGIELIGRIRDSGLLIPGVVVSGVLDPGLPERVARSGAAAFFAKPVRLAGLLEQVRHLLREPGGSSG